MKQFLLLILVIVILVSCEKKPTEFKVGIKEKYIEELLGKPKRIIDFEGAKCYVYSIDKIIISRADTVSGLTNIRELMDYAADIPLSKQNLEISFNEEIKEQIAIDKKEIQEEILKKQREIEITAENAVREYDDLKIYSTVYNKTDRLMSYVQVDGTVLDKNGIVIGTGFGNTTNLPAGRSRVITIYVPNIYDSKVQYKTEIGKYSFN